jgi:hypothetical protein
MSRGIFIAFVLLIGVACARSGNRIAGQAARESILVNVLNENYYDARVHAVYVGGQRRSLGTIAGNGGRSEVVLEWEPRALAFEVLLVTEGATYLSQPVDVAAGDSIEVRVPANIAGSGFFRRVRR